MKYLEELQNAIKEENFMEIEDVLAKIEEDESKYVLEYINEILIFIEENPNLDYGNPGLIGFFFEEYYKAGYEELLLKSVERFPTMYTVSLLNAILNDSFLKNRDVFLAALHNVTLREDIPSYVKKEAKELYLYQKAKC